MFFRTDFCQSTEKQLPDFSGKWTLDRKASDDPFFEALLQSHLKQYVQANVKTNDVTTLDISQNGGTVSIIQRTMVEAFDSKNQLVKRYSMFDSDSHFEVGGPVRKKEIAGGKKVESSGRWTGRFLVFAEKTSSLGKEFVHGPGTYKAQFTVEVVEEKFRLSANRNELTIETASRTEYPPGRMGSIKTKRIYIRQN